MSQQSPVCAHGSDASTAGGAESGAAAQEVIKSGPAADHSFWETWADGRKHSGLSRLIRSRFRELSMLVHPDKCRLPDAEQV